MHCALQRNTSDLILRVATSESQRRHGESGTETGQVTPSDHPSSNTGQNSDGVLEHASSANVNENQPSDRQNRNRCSSGAGAAAADALSAADGTGPWSTPGPSSGRARPAAAPGGGRGTAVLMLADNILVCAGGARARAAAGRRWQLEVGTSAQARPDCQLDWSARP